MHRVFIIAAALSTPAVCQSLHFGLKAGVPLTEYFDTGQSGGLHGGSEYSAATRRYTLGPTLEWRATSHFGFEADALYKRMGYVGIVTSFGNGISTRSAFDSKGNSWDFPLMAKVRFGRRARPFVAGGGVLRYIGPIRARGEVTTERVFEGTTVSPIDTSDPSDMRKRFYPGVTFGAGVEFSAGRFRIGPEFRYARWTANIAGEQGVLRFAPNQAEFLVTFLL